MQSSKLGMCERYHLSREGVRKGYLFFQKRYIIKGKGLDLGVEPPRIKRIVPRASTSKVLPVDLSWAIQQFDFESGGNLKEALLIK